MPNYHGYETTTEHYLGQFGTTYFDEDGKSNIAKDPAFAEMFTYQKKLVEELGGYDKLEKYRDRFGDEWGAKHPFHTGQVAMQLDGEWRLGMAEDAKPGLRDRRRADARRRRRGRQLRQGLPLRHHRRNRRRPARSRTPPGSWSSS